MITIEQLAELEHAIDHQAWGQIGRQRVRDLIAEVRRLRCQLEGERKARELLLAGMESQAELMDGLKQELRRLRPSAGVPTPPPPAQPAAPP